MVMFIFGFGTGVAVLGSIMLSIAFHEFGKPHSR